jgi:alkaline phosphatase
MNNKCSGFFLMTEGSQIDWAAHDNDIVKMIDEFKDFDKTIMDLINFVSEDQETLLIITADHETGGLKILKQKNGSAVIQWGTGSHTGEPVGVYAYGPGAELFNGMMDNTEIHHKILEAIGYTNLNDANCDL